MLHISCKYTYFLFKGLPVKPPDFMKRKRSHSEANLQPSTSTGGVTPSGPQVISNWIKITITSKKKIHVLLYNSEKSFIMLVQILNT